MLPTLSSPANTPSRVPNFSSRRDPPFCPMPFTPARVRRFATKGQDCICFEVGIHGNPNKNRLTFEYHWRRRLGIGPTNTCSQGFGAFQRRRTAGLSATVSRPPAMTSPLSQERVGRNEGNRKLQSAGTFVNALWSTCIGRHSKQSERWSQKDNVQ